MAAVLLGRPPVPRAFVPVLCSLLVLVSSGVAGAQGGAQDSRDPARGLSTMLQRLSVDRAGGVHVTRTFAVVFGGIKQGSGAAAGPALSREFADGSFVQVKGVYSIRQFKLLQGRYDSRRFFHHRLSTSTRVRWQDAPELSLYRLGPDSPNRRVEYSERRSEWSGTLTVPLRARTMLLGGTGIERYATSGGWLDAGEDEILNDVPQAPALGTRPWFLHSFVEIVQDSRLSPDFSRSGRLLDAAVHAYRDQHDGTHSFRLVTLAAYQLIPLWRERASFGFGGSVWMSAAGDGREVPFFLMPTLGGGNYLRGYSSYRFRDRNAVLLAAEYRWTVHPMVDLAALYEAGTVSSTVHGMSLARMAQSAGGGVRVHTNRSGVLRADLARGRDGFKLAFGVSVGRS